VKELNKKVRELAHIAAGLPENLQLACFELLLKNYLGVPPAEMVPIQNLKDGTGHRDANNVPDGDDPPPATEEDIGESDLHAKTRRFLAQNGLSIDHVNNLFYKEDGETRALFEDLKTTLMSDGQIRIALLQAFSNAIGTGNFDAGVEAVREDPSGEVLMQPCHGRTRWH